MDWVSVSNLTVCGTCVVSWVDMPQIPLFWRHPTKHTPGSLTLDTFWSGCALPTAMERESMVHSNKSLPMMQFLILFFCPSGCILPEQHKGGKFKLVSCQEACDTEPGSRVPTGSVLVHHCNQGWRLNGKDTSTCSNKEWDTLPKCISEWNIRTFRTQRNVCIRHLTEAVP